MDSSAFETLLKGKTDIANLVKTSLPNSNRLVIAVMEREKITSSGIARAQVQKGEDETLVGIVLAIGKGYWTENGQWIPTTSKLGDLVLIDRMSGINIRVDREGKILPFHEDVTEDRLAVRICRQESVLWTFPSEWKP